MHCRERRALGRTLHFQVRVPDTRPIAAIQPRGDDPMTEYIDQRTGKDYSICGSLVPDLRPTRPDDDCLGMVGQLEKGRDHQEVTSALESFGFDATWSRDDQGVIWIWV